MGEIGIIRHAIDEDGASGHVGSGVGNEHHDHAGNFFRLAHPIERDFLQQILQVFWIAPNGAVDGGFDGPRADRQHAYSVGRRFMKHHFSASALLASIALATFWGIVTAGRILFAAIEKWVPEKMVCRVLPLVVAAAFVASACVPKSNPSLGILTFALAGLGCSALLPLTISFSQKELTTIAASVAGGLIAFYQIGYGLAAFGVGPLQTWAGSDLSSIYGGTAAVALAMAALSFVVTRQSRPWK
jgi:O-antigen ligase